MTDLLTIEDLTVHFDTDEGVVQAVDGAALSIAAGEVVGLVGESGSGKSVTAMAILRLLRPPARIVSGRIHFDGRDLLTVPEEAMRSVRGSQISMVFQSPRTSLNPVLPVGRQIERLLALHGGATLGASRPFFPADVAAALAEAPAPRLLVTTPFHLKTIVDADIAIASPALVLCATAPLSPQLAARAEERLGAPLLEIYGCTEAGQVATRRTVAGAEWHTFDGVRIDGDGDAVTVSGGHVPEPTVLADVLEVTGATTFKLLGRSNDLINVAGKRSSIAHLNFHLNTIRGVVDGAFWMPPDDDANAVVRLVAFVVAPGVEREQIVAALRDRVDAAFLPRRVVHVDALPRAATGKLTAERMAAFAKRLLHGEAR